MRLLLLIFFAFSLSLTSEVLELEASTVTGKRDQPDITFFIRRSSVDLIKGQSFETQKLDKIKDEVFSNKFFEVSY